MLRLASLHTQNFFKTGGGQSEDLSMIPTLREIRGGASPSKFGGGQSRDIFRGGPVKKITLYINFKISTKHQHLDKI